MEQVQYDPLRNAFSVGKIKSEKLSQVMWHITKKCENNCVFCLDKQGSANQEGLWAYSQITQAIKLLSELGVQKIDISGGEPLLSDRLVDIVTCCKSAGIHITLTTSGCGTPSNVSWLFDNWSLFSRVILSLDGLEEEHNYLRKNQYAFSNFSNCYLGLIDAGCNCLRINSVITKVILSDEYSAKFANAIADLHPQEWCIIKPYKRASSPFFDAIDISESQYDAFYCKCIDLLKNLGIKIIRRANNIYSSYWTLTSSNLLISDNPENSYSIPFDFNHLEEIKHAIGAHDQFLPKE